MELQGSLKTPFGTYTYEDFKKAIFDEDQVFWSGGYSQKKKSGEDEKGDPIFEYTPKVGTFFTPNAIDLSKVIAYNAKKYAKKDPEQNARLRRGITQKTMDELTCCFAEFDEGTTEEQFNRLLTLLDNGMIPLAPTAIVHSGDSRQETVALLDEHQKPLLRGKSLHLFWRFNEPVSLSEWRKIQISLIHILQSDEALKDPCRSMRLGGVISDQAGPFSAPDFKEPFAPSRKKLPARVQTILYLGSRVSKEKMLNWAEQVFAEEKISARQSGTRGRVFRMYRNESTVFDPRSVTTEYDGETISIWELSKKIPDGDSLSICSPFHEDHSPSAKLFKRKNGQVVIRNYSSNAPNEWYEADRNADLVYEEAMELDHKEFHEFQLTKKLNVFATQMGSGKTHKVQELVKEESCSVLAITARRSLVSQMSHRLNIEHYEELPREINEPRCAICINSLARIQSPNFDYVFVDEVEEVMSALFQGGDSSFISPTEASEIMHRLRIILRESKTIIIADANASLPTVETFMEWIGIDQSQLDWITGGSKQAPCDGKTLFVHPSLDSLRVHVQEAVTEGKKLFVGCTMKREVLEMEASIRQWNENIRVKSYHGHSSPEVIAELEDVNKSWVEADVVLSSPIVSSGVSFDVPDYFDHVVIFGQFRQGVAREDLLQQMGRVRKPKNPVIHAYFSESEHQRPRDFLGVAASALEANRRTREFLSQCGIFCEKMIQTPLDIHYFNAIVRARLVHNIRSYNIKDLMCRYWIANDGEVQFVNRMEDPEQKVKVELQKEERKKIKERLKKKAVEGVMKAEELSDEEVSELEKKYDTLEPEERDQLWKYRIQNKLGSYYENLLPEEKEAMIDKCIHGGFLGTVDRFSDIRLLFEKMMPSEVARRDFQEISQGLLASKNKGARLVFLNLVLSAVCDVTFGDLFTPEGLKKWSDAEWSQRKIREKTRKIRQMIRCAPHEFDSGTDLRRSHPVKGINSFLRYFGFRTKKRQVRVKGSANRGRREYLYRLDLSEFQKMLDVSECSTSKREHSELEQMTFEGVTLATVQEKYSMMCDTSSHEKPFSSFERAKKFYNTLLDGIGMMRKGAVIQIEDLSQTLFDGGPTIFSISTVTDPAT